jgi:AraC family transcriptional regulator
MDQKVLPALYHVQSNLDGDLELEALARVAGFSPSHFHEVFQAEVGETPRQYVERIRLERAAFHLRIQDEPILRVALDVGYQSHETFSRAFKRRFMMTPSDYRRAELGWPAQSKAKPASSRQYSLSATSARRRKRLKMAFIRHVGPYETVPPELWSQLEQQLHSQGWPSDGPRVGLGHDSPSVTSPEQCRFDAGILVDEPVEVGGDMAVQWLDSGPAAVTTVVGPYSSLPQAYPEIFSRAANLDGYDLVALPVLEIYQAQEMVAHNPIEFTEVYMPLRRAQD